MEEPAAIIQITAKFRPILSNPSELLIIGNRGLGGRGNGAKVIRGMEIVFNPVACSMVRLQSIDIHRMQRVAAVRELVQHQLDAIRWRDDDLKKGSSFVHPVFWFFGNEFGNVTAPRSEWETVGPTSAVLPALREMLATALNVTRRILLSWLRFVNWVFLLLLRTLERPQRLREFVIMQRSWHLRHGAHPPRGSSLLPQRRFRRMLLTPQ